MICDLHTHSEFSFDGRATLPEMAEAARSKGVDVVAVTDHCDMLDIPDGFQSYLDREQARLEAFREYREGGMETELLYGIEIGNANDYPQRAQKLMEGRQFDFVIGSVHFLPDGRDIYLCPYASPEEIDGMFRDYFRSMRTLSQMGGFDTLAHLDYPVRVLKGKIPDSSVLAYRDLIEPILEALVQNKIALEINTRGTYDWQNRVGPEDWVLTRYRQLGGRYVTIGSDAHTVEYIGAGFRDAVEALKRNGFDAFTIYRDRKPIEIPIV